ncbi:hypothetical protein D3C86_2092000 [compost metagenome]
MPVSSSKKSAGVSEKSLNAVTVVTSKKVIPAPPLVSSTSSSAAFSFRVDTSSLASRMRSLKRTRWGEL